MTINPFGDTPAGPVHRVVLGRAPGPVLEVMDLGATMHALHITCGDGERRNVLLGHATAMEYLTSADYLGGTIGRYANRIARGRFTLDSHQHQLRTNDRSNHLHGGPDGFDRRVWEITEANETSLELQLQSADGDQGYPGALHVTAGFEVTSDGMVRLDLAATCDAPTIVNLTSHAYIDLGGGIGIDDHLLAVSADTFTPVDGTGIPTGDISAVDGTPFDLRAATAIGDTVRAPHPQVASARGVDHNFVVNGYGLRKVADLRCHRTRTQLILSSDQPGLQVYTGNFLDGSTCGTDGRLLRQGAGIALEPQRFPDTPNNPGFGSAVLRPGQTYLSRVVWEFRSTR